MDMFGFIKKLLKRSVSISDKERMRELLEIDASAAGITLNREKVLGSAAVWRAVNLISGAVGRLPLHVYRRQSDGGRERDQRHPAYQLLKNRPAPLIPAFTFKQTLTHHALMHGNGWALITRKGADPVNLTILDPEATGIVKEKKQLWYVTHVENKPYKLWPEEVLHIRGLSSDGMLGYPIISVLKEALSTGITLTKYGNTYFKQGANPTLAIYLPPGTRPEAIERIRKDWNKIHQGIGNVGKVAMLEAGMDVKSLTVSNEQTQWLASREFDLVTVANAIGLPASYLGSQVNTSYASLEQDTLRFLADIEPWLCTWEQECMLKLLTEVQKEGETHHIEFLREALLRSDSTTQHNILISELTNGVTSWEEVRRIKNKPAEWGEEHWYRPANLLIQQGPPEEPEPQPQAAPEPLESPAETEEEQPEEEQDNSRSRLLRLTEATLRRMVARLAKSTKPLGEHREVIQENLALSTPEWVDSWLATLEEELSHVLPEQRQEVFARIDISKLAEELWKKDTAQ